MTPELPHDFAQPRITQRLADIPAAPIPLLPVVLHDNGTGAGLVHVVLHPPLLGDLALGSRGTDLAWDTRVPATVTTLCGITTAADHVTVLNHLTGAPCERCVLVRILDTLHHPHGRALTTPAGFGGELRGYAVPGDLARAALRLLTDRATPAPALVDDRAPDELLVLTVTPFDGPLPWPDSVGAVADLPDFPTPPRSGPTTGPVRWHHLPTTTRLASDIELCASLVAAARDLGHPVTTVRTLNRARPTHPAASIFRLVLRRGHPAPQSPVSPIQASAAPTAGTSTPDSTS